MNLIGGADSYRYFKVISVNNKNIKDEGRYKTKGSPSDAAKKAFTQLSKKYKTNKLTFSIKETTQISNKKIHGPYLGEKTKLKKPLQVKYQGKNKPVLIKYEIKVHLVKDYKQKGGKLGKSEFKSYKLGTEFKKNEFVLIGSNSDINEKVFELYKYCPSGNKAPNGNNCKIETSTSVKFYMEYQHQYKNSENGKFIRIYEKDKWYENMYNSNLSDSTIIKTKIIKLNGEELIVVCRGIDTNWEEDNTNLRTVKIINNKKIYFGNIPLAQPHLLQWQLGNLQNSGEALAKVVYTDLGEVTLLEPTVATVKPIQSQLGKPKVKIQSIQNNNRYGIFLNDYEKRRSSK